MSFYDESEEDSFEDFLEWRRWKKERRRHRRRQKQRARIEGGSGHHHHHHHDEDDHHHHHHHDEDHHHHHHDSSEDHHHHKHEHKHEHKHDKKDDVEEATVVVDVDDTKMPADTKGNDNSKQVNLFLKKSEAQKKQLRVQVSADTKSFTEGKAYTSHSGNQITLNQDDIASSIDGTVVYNGSENFGSFPNNNSTTAHFVKADAIETGLYLIEKKRVSPVVVIPVDPNNKAGDNAGTNSLEEQLWRRTSISASLKDIKYEISQKGCIYVPDVLVFRDSEAKNGYALFDRPRKLSFILASSVANPKITGEGNSQKMDDASASLTKDKFLTILSVGLKHGHDSLVMSAFGCGYNKNPPAHVAELFHSVLTSKVNNAYKHVTFAIIPDANSQKAHNPEGNLYPFQKQFVKVAEKSSKQGCC